MQARADGCRIRPAHRLERGTIGALALLLFLAPAPAALAGADLPLPEPDPERGTIAVTLRGRAPAGTRSPAVQVFFVRLGPDVDVFAADNVICSDFSKKKQVYLLNARPGRYVAVAARMRGSGGSGGEYKVFLDKETIRQTEIEVTPGGVTFMGDFLVDMKMKMSKSDEAQAHYFRLIEPGAARRGFASRTWFGKQYMYRGDLVSLDREDSTRSDFLVFAGEKVFDEEPAWRARIEERLSELRAP